MNKIRSMIKGYFPYYLIYFLFIIELLINLQSNYMSGDESFTYNMIHHSFFNIINLTSQDVHPFLYYFISKIFTYNITNMYLKIHILRIVSALPFLILLIIGNTYIKNKFSKFTSISFMFCVISTPLLIDNIYTIRMYGWATLFTIIVYLLFISAYSNNNTLTFSYISLFSILSAYTHYYALITVFILYIMFLILFILKKISIKYLIFSIIINITLYLPWLKVLLDQTTGASKNFWTSKLQLKDIIKMFIDGISPIQHLSIFYILPLVLLFAIISILINKNISNNLMIIIGLLTPYILILVGSILSIIVGHSVVMIRYITPAIGIFWLALSIFISDISSKYKILKYTLIIVTLLICILSYGKTNKHTIDISKQFNQTLRIYNKIPKDSSIIYDDTETMSGISNYLSNSNSNYTLNNYNSGNNVYKKVLLNKFEQKKNTVLPLQHKNIFYVKTDKNNSELIKRFNNKYINNKTYLFQDIYLPVEYSRIIKIYKIK